MSYLGSPHSGFNVYIPRFCLIVTCLPSFLIAYLFTISQADAVGIIGVLEISPGIASGEHLALQGLVDQVSHPETGSANIGYHATAVTSRIFPDNGLSDTPIDGGLAQRDLWKVWSYQAQSRTAFERAMRELGPVARIINHSAGYTRGTGGGAVRTKAVDRTIFRYRNLVTLVAHNQGPGDQSLLEPAGSYNAIVIGATGPEEAPADEKPFRGLAQGAYIAGYSSRGPTSDGRRKPDFVAPGTFVTLADYDPNNPGATILTSGTSFAAPYVASVAASLIEEADRRGWNSDPLVLKSVMLNSAQEVSQELNWTTRELQPEIWDGWTPQQTDKPLDIDQGTGEISTPRARWQYFSNPQQDAGAPVSRVGWDYADDLSEGNQAWYYFPKPVHAGATLTATLNWFREFSTDDEPLDLDNLDLELWRTDGQTPLELVTLSNSSIDNVEHIHRFDIPASGFYALSVNFRESFTPAAPDEYGIAWLLPESTFLEGDANLDGWVDLDDFATWKSGVGRGNLLSEGDFDLDGDVDLADAELLKANFGKNQPLAAVPEPSLWQYVTSLVVFAGPFTFARQRLVRASSSKLATS